MYRLVNKSGKFMSQLTDSQKNILEQVGKFCKGKMDGYVAVDTGELKSMNEYVIANNELYLQNKSKYAGFQEFGTIKMPAHPFMRPAIFNHLPEIKNIAGDVLRRGIG